MSGREFEKAVQAARVISDADITQHVTSADAAKGPGLFPEWRGQMNGRVHGVPRESLLR
jgi:hypothetical protein